MGDLLLKNCSEIVYSSHGLHRTGKNMSTIDVLQNHDILICNGKIMTIQENINPVGDIQIVDCAGKTIIPGFVDAHTHPVFDGDRANEFAMKLAGASYMDIHAAGGGIHYTVKKTAEASEERLLDLLRHRLDQMVGQGTTTIEAKSGYGLELDTEIKMLKVLKAAKGKHDMHIQSTYLAAHAVPIGRDAAEMTEEIVNTHIPAVAALDLDITNIDVFCEEGVYDSAQTRRICEAGKEHGWHPNVHVEEIIYIGGAEMAVEYGARAVSHLEMVSDAAIKSMAENDVSGVVLPTTAYILKLVPPPARKMIDAGVNVALGSDFNPNAPCFSMPMVMHLACILCGMNMAEALNAATINAAHSLGLEADRGSITTGKRADLVILNSPNWKHIIYQLGNHQNLVDTTIINGKIVSS